MREMKLKTFLHVDFRKSEWTNFQEFIKTDLGGTLRRGEGVMFISLRGDQFVFVEPADEFDVRTTKGTTKVQVLASQRFRIRGSKWDPLMLANYAERAGIRIQGIKRFEWYYRDYIAEQRDAA